MNKKRYRTFKMSMALANKIEEVIESGEHGYINFPDFINEAISRYLRELGYLT